MLQQLGAEHTCDVDLLPESPVILDVGARGYGYDKELLAIRPNAKIYALEPDPGEPEPDDERIKLYRWAMTGVPEDEVIWQGGGDGSYIVGRASYGWGACDPLKAHRVTNVTLQNFMKMFGIEHFDLIKLDCEGSEFAILENWPGPVATQISIEFHDYIDRNKWSDQYYEYLFGGPLHDYKVVKHDLVPLGPVPTFGHWDSLLILKGEAS